MITGMTSGSRVDGAEFAMQMMRFPYRQVFAQDVGDAAVQNDAFRPTLGKLAQSDTASLNRKLSEG